MSLKLFLQEIIKMIDNGELTELSDDDLEQISIIIHKPEALGREAAAKFLGISLNKFHELRDLGIIPCPKKKTRI